MDTDDSPINWNFAGLGYYPKLGDVACVTPDWMNCTYELSYTALGPCRRNSNYLMLSCTGIFYKVYKLQTQGKVLKNALNIFTNLITAINNP